MLNCKQCGSSISDDSLFCHKCGSPVQDVSQERPVLDKSDSGNSPSGPEPEEKERPGTEPSETTTPDSGQAGYCGSCGAKIPDGCAYCLICGTKSGETAPSAQPVTDDNFKEEEAGVPLSETPGTVEVKPARKGCGPIFVCAAIFVLLALSAAALWITGVFERFGLVTGAETRAKDALIYVTSDGRLMFTSPKIDAPELVTAGFKFRAGESVSDLAKASADGRYIAYINGYMRIGGKSSGKLYLRGITDDFSKQGISSPDSELISENVCEFYFYGNGNGLVFLTSGGGLYADSFSEDSLIDNGVTEITCFSEGRMIYRKASAGSSSFYTCTPDNHEKVIIDSDILSLADYTPKLDRFVYLHEQPDKSRDIIAFDRTLDSKTILASGVDSIIRADAETFTVLYQTVSPNPFSYGNLIYDEFAGGDERFVRPEIEDYPILEEFFNSNIIDDDYSADMENYEEFAEARNEYQTALDEYDKKLERDKLRAGINDDIKDFIAKYPVRYDLRLHREGSAPELLGSSFKPFEDADLHAGNDLAAWTQTVLHINYQISVSEYENIVSGAGLTGYLENMMSETVWVKQSAFAPAMLNVGDGNFHTGGFRLAIKDDGKYGIYFSMAAGSPSTDKSNSSFTLYYSPVEEGVVKSVVLADKNVSEIAGMLSGGRLLYTKQSYGGACDLYITDNRLSGEKIGSGVTLEKDYFKIENDGKTLLFCEFLDETQKAGELFMFTDQKRQLAIDVNSIFYRDDSNIYLLCRGNGSLFVFGSGGLSQIDENVSGVMK